MAKKGHVPVRMCAGCRKRRPKGELIRLALNSSGETVVDKRGTRSGRGVYLCPSRGCLEVAIKKRGLVKAFRGRMRETVPEEVFRVFQEEGEWRK